MEQLAWETWISCSYGHITVTCCSLDPRDEGQPHGFQSWFTAGAGSMLDLTRHGKQNCKIAPGWQANSEVDPPYTDIRRDNWRCSVATVTTRLQPFLCVNDFQWISAAVPTHCRVALLLRQPQRFWVIDPGAIAAAAGGIHSGLPKFRHSPAAGTHKGGTCKSPSLK